MSDDCPIKGQYDGGQYVLVKDPQMMRDLEMLGYFGERLGDARRRDGHLKDYMDQQIDDCVQDDDVILALSLNEAFFLMHSLGCLKILENDSTDMTIDDCWRKFRQYYANSNIQIDFAKEYAVYHFFRTRGWTAKSGENYGTNFILYRENPDVEHSQYCVLILDKSQPNFSHSNELNSLLTFHRVAQSVGKEIMIVYIDLSDPYKPLLDKPSCIRAMSLATKLFTGHPNLMTRSSGS